MAGLKRRALTADDLLRLQEGPDRKRIRRDLDSDSDSDVDGVSGSEQQEAANEDAASATGSSAHSGSVEDSDNSDAGSASGSGSEDEDAEDAAKGGPFMLDDTPEDGGRFSSRVSIIPRRAPGASRTAHSPAESKPTSFSTFGVSAALLAALQKLSIRVPTEIQAACIPPLLQGRDCIGNAKTGAGKTIAFALPIIQRLSVDPYGIFALVLTPTRELAFQISEQFAVLGAALSLRTAVVVGGMDMIAQALELNTRPHVVVATPGRIVDHLRSSSAEWDLSRVKFLVLDEADRLLTPTFAPELSYLFDVLPKERQTCLFTATLTDAVERLAEAPPRPGKQKPFIHRMTETVETVETLKQHYILVPSHVRESYLFYLLCNPPESTLHLRRAPPEPAKHSRNGPSKPTKKKPAKKPTEDEDALEQPPPTIVFCQRPRTAAYLAHLLRALGVRAAALHSRLTQKERLNALGLFRAFVVPVLVSTDVGARGLDVADVALVVNWDMPDGAEEYTHRVGRTARAGRGGVAVSFVTEYDEERVRAVEWRIKTQLAEMTLPEARVLEKLNAVSTAKRLANMELHDSDFGRREEIHRIKSAKRRADVEAAG